MSVRAAEGAGATGAEAKERRGNGGQRVQFEALVAVGEAAGGGFEAESVDVSPDGMRLRTAYLPGVGDKLICRFDGMGAEVVAEGEVIWRNEEARGGEFGMRFVGVDAATAEAIRAMCGSLGGAPDEESGGDEPAVPRGSRVRLHIEGLGSPMKARVRESASREVEVGSNLEFLKVGRSLQLEDVDQGQKREVTIDGVKVDVDPATNVPQLVVTLRYHRPSEDKAAAPAPAAKRTDKLRSSAVPAARRTLSGIAPEGEAAPASREHGEGRRASVRSEPRRVEAEDAHAREAGDHEAEAEQSEAGDDGAYQAAPGFGAKAATAGRAVAGRLGPVLAGVGSRAKDAMSNVTALLQKKRAERDEAKRASAPRRTTAPPPGGALKSDGRRGLVRDDGMDGEDDAPPPPRPNRRAAAVGGVLGLCAVLAIFAMTKTFGAKSPPVAAANGDNQAAIAALPAPEVPAAAAPGTPTVNVPLFGATPASTTEPVAPPPAASGAPSAAASGDPQAGPPGDDGPAGEGGPILKEWGQGAVGQHPLVLKIKTDGPIERITGASGAMGFTVSMPGRRSVQPPSDLARKDKRLASVKVINTSQGAEVTVQFKDGVPPYLAKVKGDKLEITVGREAHTKIAKKKAKKKKP